MMLKYLTWAVGWIPVLFINKKYEVERTELKGVGLRIGLLMISVLGF